MPACFSSTGIIASSSWITISMTNIWKTRSVPWTPPKVKTKFNRTDTNKYLQLIKKATSKRPRWWCCWGKGLSKESKEDKWLLRTNIWAISWIEAGLWEYQEALRNWKHNKRRMIMDCTKSPSMTMMSNRRAINNLKWITWGRITLWLTRWSVNMSRSIRTPRRAQMTICKPKLLPASRTSICGAKT